MKMRARILALGCMMLCSSKIFADIAIITHQASPLTSLDKETATLIFLKKIDNVNGLPLTPLDLPKGDVRNRFYLQLANRTADQLLAYWCRLLFTGKGRPPQMLHGGEEMLERVSKEIGTIGYLETDQLNDQVKVLLLIRK